jgi:antitoxin MazE
MGAFAASRLRFFGGPFLPFDMRAIVRRMRRGYDVITSEVRVRAKLVRIGNSRGIRLPKAVIDELNLGDEVELTVKKGELVVSRVKKVREGWAEDAKLIAQRERGTLMAPPVTERMLRHLEWPEEDFRDFDK